MFFRLNDGARLLVCVRIYRFVYFVLVVLACVTCRSSLSETPRPTLPVQALPGGFTFFALADWGVDGLFHQQAVADQMDRFAGSLSPAFVVMAGDNFYTKGVGGVDDPQWLTSFEQVYRGTHLPDHFQLALGNHDYQQHTQAQLDYGKQHTRWQLPARYYTSVISAKNTSIRLVVLDTSPFVEAYRQNVTAYPDILQNTTRQLQWADSVLIHATEPWKIVVGHHPIYSAGADHGDQPELVQQLLPLLRKYGVQLYLNGHSHTLQHIFPGGATDYIVTGGGGASLGTIADSTRCRFSRASGGFTVVSINADSLQATFVNQVGQRLYQFSRPRVR